MTLREEIAQCIHYHRDRPCSDGDFVRLSDVLAIIDSWTANGTPLLTYGAVDDKPAAPSSEERPARDEFRVVLARLPRETDASLSPTIGSALLTGIEAILESIDANTAAIRETRT